jgi:hypothetical protein
VKGEEVKSEEVKSEKYEEEVIMDMGGCAVGSGTAREGYQGLGNTGG